AAGEERRGGRFGGAPAMTGPGLRPPDGRPPLTKKFMAGPLDATALAADPVALGLDLRLGEAATGLEFRQGKAATGPESGQGEAATGVGGGGLLADPGGHAFDALVVAPRAA